jgi:Flp pilus assembly protein TadG
MDRFMRLNRRGVSLSEAVLVMPLFLFLVFGILQAGQIGIGLIVVNYAAGSVARKAARTSTPDTNSTNFQAEYDKLMSVGMKSSPLDIHCDGGCVKVTNDVIVTAEATMDAFPVFGPILNSMAPSFKTSATWKPNGKVESVPALGFQGPPYKFIVRGMAVARMNYHVQ